jgi:hypothetical protein
MKILKQKESWNCKWNKIGKTMNEVTEGFTNLLGKEWNFRMDLRLVATAAIRIW